MDTDGIIHITDLAELTEEDLRAMDELLDPVIEDWEWNAIVTGCLERKKK